jgi:hypothetical protein
MRAGFEIELLAPPGRSRRDLADLLAQRCGGEVRPVWHQDSEPVPIESLGGRFLHLTQGFEVTRPSGELLCTVVDDVTITAELDARAAAPDCWIRVLTDDVRLLQVLADCCDPAGPLDHVLDQAAGLWNVGVEQIGNIWRIETRGATIALALPAGGERERPCEIVTPPLSTDHQALLEELLAPARELGFTVPVEAAVHIHVDGKPFRSAPAIANLIRLFGYRREELRDRLGTNPNCRRLAPLPHQLLDAVRGTPSIEDLRTAAEAGNLSKFYDINLTQLLTDTPWRDTVEIRILPGTLDAADVVRRASIVERLLLRCLDPQPISAP